MRPRALLVASAAGLLAVGAAPAMTMAAWTDDVWTVAAVAAGTWDASGGEGGIEPGNDDTVIVDLSWNVLGPTQVCADVYVTTDSTTPVSWSVTVDPAERPWNGVAPSLVQINNGGSIANPGGSPLSIVGNSDGTGIFDQTANNTPIVAGQTGLVQICSYNTPPPAPGDPSWYTASSTAPALNMTGTGVCSTLTVSGLVDVADDPFYFGWTTVVDLQPLLDELAAAGLTYTHTDFANSGGFTFAADQLVPPSGTEYLFTSGAPAALQGMSEFQTTTCVFGSP